MTSTMIRVPRELHARLAQRASEQHISLAAAIEEALDAAEDTAFWAEVRTVMGGRDASLRAASERDAALLRAGLDPEERWDDVL